MLNGIQLSLLKHDAQVPFQVNITSNEFLTGIGAILECVEILRVSTQKKMVCKADFQGQRVIAKFFFNPEKANKDYEQEIASYNFLIKAQVNTPRRLKSGILNKSGFYVLYEYIESIDSLENQTTLKPNENSLACINRLIPVIAQMHNSNIQQIDLQLNHFSIQNKDQLIVVDNGEVIALKISSSALSNEIRVAQIHKNLAMIFSQLSVYYDQYREDFLNSYQLGTVLSKKLSPYLICQEMKQLRQSRLQKYLKKTLIDNHEFMYEESKYETLLFKKEYATGQWLIFYQQLNNLFESSSLLKKSNKKNGSVCIVLAKCGDKEVVIKRYEYLRLAKARLSSQAWNSWQNAHQLKVLGIKTPKPIAIIEQHSGLLKNYSFYLTEYEDSEDALKHYSNKAELSEEHLEEFKQLFSAMINSKISHSHLTADNILLSRDGLSLNDLDALKFYSSASMKTTGFRKVFAKDLQTFMKNWPLNSTMYQQFQKILKELPDKPFC